MKKIILYLFVFYFLIQNINMIYACSSVYTPPIKFDLAEYIFTGKVIGYTGPLYSDSLERSFQGLIIEVVDPVYLPKTPSGFFEIIPYLLSADCSLNSWDIRSLQKFYPLGTVLRIIGIETRYLRNNIPPDVIRLDVSSLSKNFKEPSILYSTDSSIYDYRYMRQDSLDSFKKLLPIYDSQTASELRASFQSQFYFELAKDLYRLSIAHSDSGKAMVIKRLFYFRHYSKRDFLNIINMNIKNENTKKELISLVPKRLESPPIDTTLHSEIPAALSSRWYQTSGPCGGFVSCLVLKENSNKSVKLFAGTARNGVFRSTDFGKSWAAINNGLKNHLVYSLFVSGKYIFAGTDSGAFRSTNDGDSWLTVDSGFTKQRIFRVIVFAETGEYMFAGTNGNGIFRSSDKGDRWIQVNNGLVDKDVDCFFASDSALYVGTSGGVFVTKNNGDKWQAINHGLPQRYYPYKKLLWLSINTIFMSGEKLFIGIERGGMFSSTDYGATWDTVNLGIKPFSVNKITGNPSNLFVSTFRGLFHSADNGKYWTAINSKFPDVIHGNNIFSAGPMGILRSTDKGKSWKISNSGLRNTEVNSLTKCGKNLYANSGGKLYFSGDGNKWSVVTENSFIKLTTFASDNKNFLAGTSKGVFLSTDSGKTWDSILHDVGVRKIFLIGDTILVALRNGVLRSTDFGENWEKCLSDVYVHSFGIIKNKIFIINTEGVLLSDDYGSSWSPMTSNLKCEFEQLVSNENYLYAVTSGCGIMSSTDNGNTWQIDADKYKYYHLQHLITYGKYLFAGTWDHGIYFSKNHGKDWIPFNFGLKDMHAISLIIKDDVLYTGTLSGVWAHKLKSNK